MNCWKIIIVSVHHKNLQALATEMYNVSNNISPAIVNDVFTSRATPYNLRSPVSFKIRKVYSVTMILKLPQLGPKIWSILPQEIRQSNAPYVIVPVDYGRNIYIKQDSFEKTYAHKFGSCFYYYYTYFKYLSSGIF